MAQSLTEIYRQAGQLYRDKAAKPPAPVATADAGVFTPVTPQATAAAGGNPDQAKMSVVYKLTCVLTGKAYIGITTRGLAVRWADHLKRARCSLERNQPLYNAIRKYGGDKFVCEVIKVASSLDELLALERRLIVEHGTLTPFGYNVAEGGRVRRMRRSTKKKLSRRLFGRTFSESTIVKMKIAAADRHQNYASSYAQSWQKLQGKNCKPVIAVGEGVSWWFRSVSEACRVLNVRASGVYGVLAGMQKTAGGWTWMRPDMFMEAA
jgi:group I intron endonuclease